MKTSSISLAAVLALAAPHSAVAGAQIVYPQPNRVPPTRFVAAPLNPTAGRFAPTGLNWGGAPRWLPLGFIGLPEPQPSDGGEALVVEPIESAPMEVTFTVMTPLREYGYARSVASVGGPKIITIGAPSKFTRFRKAPIIIYGAQVGRGY